MLVREVEGRGSGRGSEKQADRVELERVMIVTTVVRTNEHLGTAFGIFQVSSNAQRRVALYLLRKLLALIYLLKFSP